MPLLRKVVLKVKEKSSRVQKIKLMRKMKMKRRRIIVRTSLLCIIMVSIVTFAVKSFVYDDSSTDVKTVEANTEETTKKVEPKKPNPEDIIPGSNIIYSAEPYAVDMHTVKEIVDNKYTGKEKMVFLTFDDGPSPNTEKVLNILKEKGVHGTFFVMGQSIMDKNAKEYLTDTIKGGNAIGNHSFSHSLSILYPNNQLDVNTFMAEYDKTNNLIKSILGQDFDSKVLRMPGGYMSRRYYKDPQLPNFDKVLNDRGIVSIDWDSMTGDAEPQGYDVQQLISNLENKVANYTQTVVLMHDTYGKEKTVEALPEIIDYFKAKGFDFKVIKSTVDKK